MLRAVRLSAADELSDSFHQQTFFYLLISRNANNKYFHPYFFLWAIDKARFPCSVYLQTFQVAFPEFQGKIDVYFSYYILF